MKKVTFRQCTSGVIDIDGVADCGQSFHIGVVLEPDSENPVLRLDMPLGMKGLRQVLDAWENHRNKVCNCWDSADGKAHLICQQHVKNP